MRVYQRPVSLASGARRTIMAPVGQNSWQQKQRMHACRSIRARPPRMAMALAGQSRAHFPQPVHVPSGSGRERKARYNPRLSAFRSPRSCSDGANHEAVAPER